MRLNHCALYHCCNISRFLITDIAEDSPTRMMINKFCYCFKVQRYDLAKGFDFVCTIENVILNLNTVAVAVVFFV